MKKRWKSIKQMSRQSPVDCFEQWYSRKNRLGKLVACSAPESIIEWSRQMEHDSAVAVRMCRSDSDYALGVEHIGSKLNQLVRQSLATQGREVIPDEMPTVADDCMDALREAFKGTWPLPDQNAALLEILWAIHENPPP